jgi:sarcosine oxidase
MREFDAVVVGLGAMGSAITYQLATHGIKVLGLEKFSLNHTNGSSHGKTRIIRTSYFHNPYYVPLAKRAFELWSTVQSESGRNLITMTGAILYGLPDSTLISGGVTSSKKHNLAYEILDSQEAANRFPMFQADDDEVAFYEAGGGILFPEECIQAHATLAEKSGAELHFNEPEIRWHNRDGRVEVKTGNESYNANYLILSPGAWLTALVPELRLPLQTERQVVFWFKPPVNQEIFSPSRMPVYVWQMKGEKYYYYGVPDVGGGVKAAKDHDGELTPPDHVRREVTWKDEEPVRQFLKHHIPSLDSTPTSSMTCLYTNTPDGHFIIDFHPNYKNVIIVSACSGHGFKFSSVIGEVVREMVQDGKSKHDISLFEINRFAGSES